MFAPPAPVGAPELGRPVGSQLFCSPVVHSQPPPVDVAPPETDFDRSINYAADFSGCGHWRMIWPAHIINAHQKGVIHTTTMMILDERYYVSTKSVRVQRQATEQQLQFIRLLTEYKKRHNFNIIYEIDDIVFSEDIPDYNKFKAAFVDPKIRECAMEMMKLVDEITVTNKFMRDYYIDKTGNKSVTVIPNYPPKWWIGNFYDRNKISRDYQKHKKRPRIAYCASGAHFDVENRVKQRDDFAHVINAVRKTANKYHWVFLGAFPLGLKDLVIEGKIEFHNWRRLYEYPSLVHELDINMLVAPLQDNTFNRAKSDLKYIEACCYGLPIACQDICTYENAPIRFRTGDEMIDQIRTTLKHQDKYMTISKSARGIADNRWLENDNNADQYMELYKFPYKDSQRKRLNSLEQNQ